MSIYVGTTVEGDEKVLYGVLLDYFERRRDIIRVDRNVKPDCILHSIKNKRTRNTTVIKDARNHGGSISITAYSRLKHVAANIHKDYVISFNVITNDLLDTSVALDICKFMTTESEFSQTVFDYVKATKKRIEDLNDDEVFAGRITHVSYLNENNKLKEPYMDLRFENNSGTYCAPISEILQLTANPLGSYFVINKQRQIAFYSPAKFKQYFIPQEADNQYSKPADLF